VKIAGFSRSFSYAAKESFMSIPFRLDYVIEKTLSETAGSEQRVLKALAGVKLSRTEARAQWTRVLEHKWILSERLGRDVELRVAIIDYLKTFIRRAQGKQIIAASAA
jgi:hypothetical protein